MNSCVFQMRLPSPCGMDTKAVLFTEGHLHMLRLSLLLILEIITQPVFKNKNQSEKVNGFIPEIAGVRIVASIIPYFTIGKWHNAAQPHTLNDLWSVCLNSSRGRNLLFVMLWQRALIGPLYEHIDQLHKDQPADGQNLNCKVTKISTT